MQTDDPNPAIEFPQERAAQMLSNHPSVDHRKTEHSGTLSEQGAFCTVHQEGWSEYQHRLIARTANVQDHHVQPSLR